MARKEDCTDTKKIEIALTLSGGGYRAAIFHIGVLSYLYHLKLDDGSRLLDHITVMSTVSGGTITGMLYLLSSLKEGSVPQHLANLYKKITENNLATLLLENVAKRKNDSKLSVIKELGNVYDSVFFKGLRLETLDEVVQKHHIHHYAAYATDISNALPFRFQITNDIFRGVDSGNEAKCISKKDAQNLRLADILAASSCFPIAFEPINYPRDFYDYLEDDEAAQSNIQTMLMDGGIIDNQGVDYLIEANRQMVDGGDENLKGIDLAIISDAASSSDELLEDKVSPTSSLGSIFEKAKKIFYWLFYPINWLMSGLKFINVLQLQYTCLALSLILIGYSVYMLDDIVTMTVAAIVGIWLGAYSFLILALKKLCPKGLKKSTQYSIPKNLIWKINFHQYYRIISKRYDSFSKVVSTVMMGHIRRKNIEMLSTNGRWTNRFVIPCISTLATNSSWKEDEISKILMSEANNLMAISDVASNFHSTLWFSDEDIDSDIPKQILACGQFTICFSLYRWIIEHKGPQANMPKVLNQIKRDTVRKKLSDDWNAFKKDPYMMFEIEKIS